MKIVIELTKVDGETEAQVSVDQSLIDCWFSEAPRTSAREAALEVVEDEWSVELFNHVQGKISDFLVPLIRERKPFGVSWTMTVE